MEIKLEKYEIKTDSFNYILSEKKIAKESSDEYTTVIGYYPSLDRVVKKLLDLKIKESEEVKLNDLSTWIQLINEYITETIAQIKAALNQKEGEANELHTRTN